MFAKITVLIYNNHKIKLNRLWFDRMRKKNIIGRTLWTNLYCKQNSTNKNGTIA